MNSIFLNNARSGKNNWWRYLFTFILLSIVSLIGGLTSYLISPYIYLNLPDEIPRLLNIPSIIGVLTLLFFLFVSVCKIHKRSPMTLITSHKSIKWKNILKGMYIWFGIMSIVTFIYFLTDPNSFKFTFDLNTFGWLLLASMLAIPLFAFSEEVFFRGYLLQTFSVITPRPVLPLIVTSLIFGFLHCSNSFHSMLGFFNLIRYSLFALMLGVVVICEEGLETAIGIHIINNLFLTLICSDCTNIFGNIPSIFTTCAKPASSLFEYIPGLVLGIAQVILLWGIVFRDKLNRVKDIFMGDEIYEY